jgi:long-chain acyl-CoA synthetase
MCGWYGYTTAHCLINLSETAKLKSKEAIKKSIADTLAVLNPLLENFERLEKAVIMRENWTIENGLMTPSLK